MFIPTVHSEHCTGCGKCENACVTEEASIRVLPAPLIKGSLGEHYRLGWEEKRKAGGRSLVEERGIVDLPDRLPEGMKLDGHFDPGSERLPAGMPGSSEAQVLPSLPPGLGATAPTGNGGATAAAKGAGGRTLPMEAGR
ncbi:MAG: quinol dehydrogenase periplasmic component [Candidatus Accumulibacter adjunctus]|uniref:Quinol dehydrogenase periplasmic component n=1 Tax=Candidatus Accumulibacter adjunctus TaxID=1454001 RepID=A0A011NJ07_9PROT|nr:MAG: quinol dehydrogenase periplasmic component [Candidatus Accumulibacter adjunctus]